ncbi:MAG: iron-containing alcohol dehydrogenase [Clostridia bacterium]|nr:iron-containing alcohol dehydrogenase [Clostridia bacterium]
MIQFSEATLDTLIRKGGHACSCGRHHGVDMDYLCIRSGAVEEIPQALAAMGTKRPFIICDVNTKAAAWGRVQPVLDAAGIAYTLFCLPMAHVEPNEEALGSIVMGYDPACDCVMGIGSGVINDCSKVLANMLRQKMMIVGTAPSMDGYASNSSAMIREGVKCTLINAAPAAIICDIDIIKDAPMRMLRAGLGDMLAKYVALCEWRMSHLVTGEYYCANVAALMRATMKKIVDHAPGLARRDPDAVQATVEGLVLSGIAMSFAGISRPASGVEHYYSHLWEMMALERGMSFELHGIQVGVGTLKALRLYDIIRTLRPDREKAKAFIESFSNEKWESEVRRILGRTGETVIALEHNSFHNNDAAAHAVRIERIIEHWDEILQAAQEELPPTEQIEALMRGLGMAMEPEDIGFTQQDAADALRASRDTRNKYLTSSMLWDMGELYTMELP